MQFDS